MNKKYFLLLYIVGLVVCKSNGQSNHWEIYAGGNISNVKNIIGGQQTTLNHTLNAPHWNFGYQIGLNRNICSINSMRLAISAGLRLQLKGDLKSIHQLLPVDTFYGIRFTYAMLPVNLNWRVFPSKELFIKSGVSFDYLAHKQIIGENYAVVFESDDTFKEKLEVSCQLGAKFKIAKNIYAEIMYSQGITPIIKIPIQAIKGFDEVFKHQAFELSMIYRL